MSASLRPYLLAVAARRRSRRPGLVVAGDDRAARDLAADLRTFLAPRPVRFYPARGVRYESHLAPPPHLVGLRIAALDALWGMARPCWSRRRGARREGARSRPAPARLRDREGRADGPGGDRGPAGGLRYERVDQVEDRGQFAVRGDILDVYPATEERAVRCELFDVEVERLTWFSTFTQRSLEEVERVEIAPAAELAPEHRELAEMAASTADLASRSRFQVETSVSAIAASSAAAIRSMSSVLSAACGACQGRSSRNATLSPARKSILPSTSSV